MSVPCIRQSGETKASLPINSDFDVKSRTLHSSESLLAP